MANPEHVAVLKQGVVVWIARVLGQGEGKHFGA
jgi:hypothetical protein